MIRTLSHEVSTDIVSSYSLSSITECVKVLILNSGLNNNLFLSKIGFVECLNTPLLGIKHKATNIILKINVEEIWITIVDNGSFCNATSLQDGLMALCKLGVVDIFSSDSELHFATTYQYGRITRHHAIPRAASGTKIAVSGLFDKVPVRRAIVKSSTKLEARLIHRAVCELALLHLPVAIRLYLVGEDELNIVRLDEEVNENLILGQILGVSNSHHLKLCNITHDLYVARGYISVDYNSDRNLQFIFVNNEPLVLQSDVYTMFNHSFGILLDNYTNNMLKKESGSSSLTNKAGCVLYFSFRCPSSEIYVHIKTAIDELLATFVEAYGMEIVKLAPKTELPRSQSWIGTTYLSKTDNRSPRVLQIDCMNMSQNIHRLHDSDVSWRNPIYELSEINVKSNKYICEIEFTEVFAESFNIDMLTHSFVIGQFDKKFIACKYRTKSKNNNNSIIVYLIDQHAADERIQLERLLEAFELWPSPVQVKDYHCLCSESDVCALCQQGGHLIVDINPNLQAIATYAVGRLSSWGFAYDICSKSSKIYLLKVPRVLARCSLDHLRQILCHSLIYASETSKISMHGGPFSIPQEIMDILASKACRRAVKFGDELTYSKCKKILNNLSNCRFPFQCAHGRPSIFPLSQVVK